MIVVGWILFWINVGFAALNLKFGLEGHTFNLVMAGVNTLAAWIVYLSLNRYKRQTERLL